MTTPTLHIRGAEPTIIDRSMCGCMVFGGDLTTYFTAIPERNLVVCTWYAHHTRHGALDVWVLATSTCIRCGQEYDRHDPCHAMLYQKRYFPESHVTRGGLLEAHENAVVLAVQNRLPLGGESMPMRSNHD